MNRRAKKDSGFALLMTLMLVLLLAGVLVGLAWQSAAGALEAEDAVEELQRRWAVTSCQATLLDKAEKVIGDAEEAANRGRSSWAPIAKASIACQLAGRDYELVFTDEQAKLNVNRLLRTTDLSQARAIVTRLAQMPGSVSVRLREQSAPSRPGLPATRTSIGAYGQVFDGASPDQLVSGLVDAVTCWGSGRINVHRATDAVLAQACAGTLGEADLNALLAARRRDPSCELDVLLGQLAAIDEKQKARLRADLTDQSECHGLWVVARSPQRAWHSLVIGMTGGAAGGTQVRSTASRGRQRLPESGAATRPAGAADGGRRPEYRFTW